MPAPKRVRYNFENEHISAFYLGHASDYEPDSPVCSSCAPLRTVMTHTYDFIRKTRKGQRSVRVFQCSRCKRQWAVSFDVENMKEKQP